MQAVQSLKRPRPVSPEPEFVPSNLPSHDSKRRRIIGPDAWNGSLRRESAWTIPNSKPTVDDDDEDEDDQEEESDTGSESGGSTRREVVARQLAEYRAINMILGGLHARKQSNYSLPTPSTRSKLSPLPLTSPLTTSGPLQTEHRLATSSRHLPVRIGTKNLMPNLSNEDEEHVVRQRYEETNRLLGSLVLDRRRVLRPSNFGEETEPDDPEDEVHS